jgi:phenylalanyl-tRNA synthetase beta chain
VNISYNWLKDVIDVQLSPDELAKELTRVGLAVEGIHEHGEDFVLDIDLTSNRPDCLSHLGVARELRASTGAEMLDQPVVPSAEADADLVTIQDPDLCYRFTARIIRNVKVGPSPQWLVDRLEAIGERSINNIADITNYVMLELGQPMHAFDYDKLSGGRIIVRRAENGEKILTLKEEDKTLDNNVLAICDADRPVAIGGVIGGLESSITDTTANVLLEVAYFDRASIRATSRRLKVATEASYRFERGVDINALKKASDRATQLIVDLAEGEPGEFIDVYPTPQDEILVRSSDLSHATERLTRLKVHKDRCIEILDRLGIATTDGSNFMSPSWRHDIAIEEDLVEEVARHAGYENIAAELPPAYSAGEFQPNELRKRRLRCALADLGFDEAESYSFIDTRHDNIFEPVPGLVDETRDEKFVTLQDAVIEGAVRMRPSVIPELLHAIRLNFNHQRRDLKLFEIGKLFAEQNAEDGVPREKEVLSLVITGGELHEGQAMPVRDLDFYDLKGAVEAAFDAAEINGPEFTATDVKHLRKGQAASVSVGGRAIGTIGRLRDEIATTYKFRQPVYVAEVDLQSALEHRVPPAVYSPLARYPPITRDVSFVAKRSTTFESIRKALENESADLLRCVRFVDIYEGKGLAGDEWSITVRLEYRSDERTLVENEVEALHEQLIPTAEGKLGIKRRF